MHPADRSAAHLASQLPAPKLPREPVDLRDMNRANARHAVLIIPGIGVEQADLSAEQGADLALPHAVHAVRAAATALPPQNMVGTQGDGLVACPLAAAMLPGAARSTC